MIDVIMPAYLATEQHIELTKNAVPTFGECNLIIIDGCSPVGGGYLRSIADTYIRNKENLGYGKSVNKGLKQSEAQYVAIANNDIRVSANWQEVAQEVLNNKETYSCHFRMTDYDTPMEFGNKILYTGKERWCHASFFVINTKYFKFMYDEAYKNTFDDWDYFYMVRKAGLKTAYTDKALFQHIHSATIPYMPKHPEVNERNREYFKTKWGDYPEILFAQDFPDQMKVHYPLGFQL